MATAGLHLVGSVSRFRIQLDQMADEFLSVLMGGQAVESP